jgi:hypothetical protein
MLTILEKLRPDTDLQVYFERPSAIAALSDATSSGFTLSGTWRQQFDWAVVEWSQHNTFEHPAFRSLPDGDLSGLVLTYDEERSNCIELDSDLFPTVDWPFLRLWTRKNGVDDFYQVRLSDHATPIAGSYVPASAEMELQGTVTPSDYIGISFFGEHHTYLALAGDTLESILDQLVLSVNGSTTLTAERIGAKIRLTVTGGAVGANGNRLGVYGYVTGAATENWTEWWKPFTGGQSPSKWRVSIDFRNLVAKDGRPVPTDAVRKMRWTYSAAMQAGDYVRSEFQVRVSNWTVTGSNRTYKVAASSSRRIEDDSPEVVFSGTWTPPGIGNFSGGTIRYASTPASSCAIEYFSPSPHELYLGTRYAATGAVAEIRVDGVLVRTEDLAIPGEDILVRIPLGAQTAGTHTVSVTHASAADTHLYFDFLEIATTTTSLPTCPVDSEVTLATDWDTDHSIAVPAERTAWMIRSLGYKGRANHYVGALWFYELKPTGHTYASATVTFTGTPAFSATTTLTIGRLGVVEVATIHHLNRIGDTAETIAKAFEIHLNRGYTAVWAEAQGATLTIRSRAMGPDGNNVTIMASPASGPFVATASGPTLSGSTDFQWHTDLTASPRINRAARDWSRAFYVAMKNYGIDVAAAFSMELQHGDDSAAAGIAQLYPDGSAAWLNTPALQTNFSPASLAYWREVHRDMADIMAQAGVVPYMQFGEVQWWYFSNASGMPLYDSYTTTQFQLTHGRPMGLILSDQVDPTPFTDELAFLSQLIGTFTSQVIAFVRATHPNCRFEVLYPTDVNNTPLNRLLNYPAADWTPAALDNLKTESFTFTFTRDLDLAAMTVGYGATRGFSRDKRSFLVGIGDSSSPWRKEVEFARGEGLESIVLFALDQYCLIGYETPFRAGLRRSTFTG